MSKRIVSSSIPVFLGFFVMGFGDIVGISTNFIKADFNLSDSWANMLPMMVFLWFAIFSVPTGMVLGKYGKKKVVLFSMFITLIGLLVPLLGYSFQIMLLAFALIGIGNSIIQVSINPLLASLFSKDKMASALTLGQFIKSVSSFVGPIIVGLMSLYFSDWKLTFYVLAGITLISAAYLYLTPINEVEETSKPSSVKDCFSLLNNKVIKSLFIGIIVLVGIDVGLNVTFPQLMQRSSSLSLEKAGAFTSLYFAARTLGSFLGAFILSKMKGKKVYVISMVLGVLSMVLIMLTDQIVLISIGIVGLGLAISNVFSIIFSAALNEEPQRGNEISGLLIMGVAGGGIIPALMGLISDEFGLIGALMFLTALMVYLLVSSLRMKNE